MQDPCDSVTVPILGESNKGAASFFKTTFNGLNSLLGIAVLSVPYALSCGGWASLALLLIIPSATCYTGILIKRCMEADANIRTYPDIGEKAFGARGRLVVSIIMNLELYLITIGFLILVADNLHNMLPNLQVSLQGFVINGHQTCILLAAVIIMPTVWIDNLTTLSYVSATGIVATVVIAGSIVWSGAFDGVGFNQKGVFFNWSGIPTSLSLYTLCYCSHPIFPTLYTSMRNRKQFKWVLVLCFVINTAVCISIAILGYLMFGSQLQSQITLNLPTNTLSSKVATYTAIVNPLAKYALFLKPVVDAIESRLLSAHGKRIGSAFTGTALLCSTVLVALTIPYYGIFMSFVGSFTTVIASILLPCFCYLRISGAFVDLGFELVVIRSTVSMGLVILVVGTYKCLLQMFENLSM
ncbi:amino acid transporter AVT1I-like [Salvia divinorum]|uniref:Amino acid transporter AVT1I-like n=1 Tax=Salvia divinorum TaxID=28513 RepID=A0ABD1G3K7_SALDI